MSGNSITLNLDNTEIKLVGTAHVSRESINEVNNIIREEKPDIVCVELDQGRYNAITQNDNWEKLNISKVFREGKGFLLIANLVLSGFQRRLGNKLGVKPGEEMKAALETAQELGIPHSLCDREIQITLRRAWAKGGLWSKSKLLASLFASAFTTEKLSENEIESLKNRSELDGMMSELAEYLPSVKTTLIDERDRYLAAKIWTSAQTQVNTSSPNKKIVAVVGAGHLSGLKNHLEKIAGGEENTDVNELNEIPPSGFILKSLRFVIPAAIVALIAIGFIRMGTDKGFLMMIYWVLWNGGLAALGAILALGHPLAILVSLLGAPLTSLTPFIGVGILSGLVQATFRKPRVSDIQDIMEDITTMKGIYRNRITRALLVFFLSSLGSVIGGIVSVSAIAGLLAAGL